VDKILNEMKSDFENYLNTDKVFSDQEKRRILNHVKYPGSIISRRLFIPKIISSLTLVTLCALIVFLVLNFTDAGEKSQPATLHKEKTVVKKDPVKTIPKYSDKEIFDKVIYLQSNIGLGLLEEEVINLLGTDFMEIDNSDSESGSVKQIGYNFLVSDPADQLKISHEINVEGILNRDIGVQFFMGFSNESEVIWTTINFAEGDSVYMMSKGMNGRTIERIHFNTKDLDERDNLNVIRFTLTPEEEVIYEKFQQDLDEKHLKGLNPISIAKLYVQFQIDKKYDAAYELYTDNEGFVQWTREDDKQIPESDRGTLAHTLMTYNNIDTGKFVPDGEDEGYIEFKASPNADATSGFKMIKDEDGIWNVAFTPIQ
jgi:hypothetical protein